MTRSPRAKMAPPAIAPVGLRLYIARSTPNSVRAEESLRAAVAELDGHGVQLPIEIVDVFTNPKRAIIDGVIVTPTLFALLPNRRITMMGDLTDTVRLHGLLRTLQDARQQSG